MELRLRLSYISAFDTGNMKLCHMPFRWCSQYIAKEAITTQSISLIERSYQSLMTGMHSGDSVGRAVLAFTPARGNSGRLLVCSKAGTH